MSRDEKASDLAKQASAARDLIAALGSDDDGVNHDIIEGETSLLEAIDAALSEMRDCDITIAGCKSVEEEIAGRRKKADARSNRLRGLIEQAMVVAGMPMAKLTTATVTVRNVKPKPIITDEASIPAEYWKQPDPVLDRAAINKIDGPVPGISMSNGGTTLQIRRL